MFYQYTLIFIGSFSQLVFAAIDRNQSVPASHCYSAKKNHAQRKYFSLETQHPQANNNTNYKLDGCVPEKIWFVARHGTRYPSTGKFQDIEEVLPVVSVHRTIKLNINCMC